MGGLLALGLAQLASGCVHNVDERTIRPTTRFVAPRVVDSIGALELRTVSSDAAVVVEASWPRACHEDVRDNLTVTDTERARLVGTTGNDRWGYALTAGLVLIWPVGIIVAASSLVSYARVPPRGVRSRRTSAVVGIMRRPCPVPAQGVPVHIALPSGRVMSDVTDERGALVVLLPADEHGPVRVTADEVVTPASIAPLQPRAQPPGTVPAAPGTTRPTTRPDRRLDTLLRTARSRARAHDCTVVQAIARQVRALDPKYFATTFRVDPSITACLPPRSDRLGPRWRGRSPTTR